MRRLKPLRVDGLELPQRPLHSSALGLRLLQKTGVDGLKGADTLVLDLRPVRVARHRKHVPGFAIRVTRLWGGHGAHNCANMALELPVAHSETVVPKEFSPYLDTRHCMSHKKESCGVNLRLRSLATKITSRGANGRVF